MALRKVVVNMSVARVWNKDIWPKIDAEYSFVSCDTENELIAATQDADAIVTHIKPPGFTRKVIDNLKKCRLINNMATGHDNIDVEAATEHGICVASGGDWCIEEASDHAIALLLTCARKVARFDRVLREKNRSAQFERAIRERSIGGIAEFVSPIFPLKGQTLGIIGLGRIGRLIAAKVRGFSLRIIAFDPFLPSEMFSELDVASVTLHELLAQSDFVSLNAGLTAETYHLIGIEQLKKMKQTAYLINCARGELVDEEALYQALKEGYIAGAGLDVVSNEPIDLDHPLLTLENVVITPHLGFYSEYSGQRLLQIASDNLILILNGEWPKWFVNPEVKEKFLEKFARV